MRSPSVAAMPSGATLDAEADERGTRPDDFDDTAGAGRPGTGGVSHGGSNRRTCTTPGRGTCFGAVPASICSIFVNGIHPCELVEEA